MEDLSEMCHVIRSRARAAIAKVRVCFLSTNGGSFMMCTVVKAVTVVLKYIVLIFRLENIRDHLPATAISGLMTGSRFMALSYILNCLEERVKKLKTFQANSFFSHLSQV